MQPAARDSELRRRNSSRLVPGLPSHRPCRPCSQFGALRHRNVARAPTSPHLYLWGHFASSTSPVPFTQRMVPPHLPTENLGMSSACGHTVINKAFDCQKAFDYQDDYWIGTSALSHHTLLSRVWETSSAPEHWCPHNMSSLRRILSKPSLTRWIITWSTVRHYTPGSCM